MECQRNYSMFCKGEAEITVDGKPICMGCKEKGEIFDD